MFFLNFVLNFASCNCNKLWANVLTQPFTAWNLNVLNNISNNINCVFHCFLQRMYFPKEFWHSQTLYLYYFIKKSKILTQLSLGKMYSVLLQFNMFTVESHWTQPGHRTYLYWQWYFTSSEKPFPFHFTHCRDALTKTD